MKLPKKFHKGLTLFIVYGFLFSVLAITMIPNNSVKTEYLMNLTDITSEELVNMTCADTEGLLELGIFPSSIDLSTSPYFPKVGDQGSEGSCAAWAVTYYAYGYMEAKQHGWTGAYAGVPSQLLSPLYTYNKCTVIKTVNGRIVSGGSSTGGNANVIKNWGVSTMASFPYVLKTNCSHLLDFGSETAMREAMFHESLNPVYLMNSVTMIDNIKSALNNDAPVVIGIDGYAFYNSFKDGNFIISGLEYNSNSINHAQTIVGYDDSITDDGDIGAFKVVNSWGSTFANKGYYWMTYNATKEVTSKYTPIYIKDKTVESPAIIATVEFTVAPTRDSPIVFKLLNNDTGALIGKVTVLANSPPNSSTYLPLPQYNKKIVYDISALTAYNNITNYKFVCEIGKGYSIGKTGIIKAFTVEKYDEGWSSTSTDSPVSTPGIFTVLLKPKPIPPVVVDNTSPSSSVIVSYTVVLSGSDSGSGVKNIQYSIDNGTWMVYSSSLILTGTHSVRYYATDNANNVETIKTIYVG